MARTDPAVPTAGHRRGPRVPSSRAYSPAGLRNAGRPGVVSARLASVLTENGTAMRPQGGAVCTASRAALHDWKTERGHPERPRLAARPSGDARGLRRGELGAERRAPRCLPPPPGWRRIVDIRQGLGDGGRDRDRTCDPYDVNGEAAPYSRLETTSCASEPSGSSRVVYPVSWAFPGRKDEVAANENPAAVGAARGAKRRCAAGQRHGSNGNRRRSGWQWPAFFLVIDDHEDRIGHVEHDGAEFAAFDLSGAPLGVFPTAKAACGAVGKATTGVRHG